MNKLSTLKNLRKGVNPTNNPFITSEYDVFDSMDKADLEKALKEFDCGSNDFGLSVQKAALCLLNKGLLIPDHLNDFINRAYAILGLTGKYDSGCDKNFIDNIYFIVGRP